MIVSSKIKQTGKSATAATKPKQMTLNFQDTDEVQFTIVGFGKAIIDWRDGSPYETHTLASDLETAEDCWHVYPDKTNYTVTIVGKRITLVECFEPKLVSIDLSRNSALTDLILFNCKITSLDLCKNLALKQLVCHANCLTSLDVSRNTALTEFSCNENLITSLDVSKNIILTGLYCWSNKLTKLDVSKNIALTSLICSENQLLSLDVKNNSALTILDCSENQISNLEVSNHPELLELHCGENQLTSDALNNLLRMLPVVEEGILDINANSGTTDCDISIAQGKGWISPKRITMTVQGAGEVIIQIAGYDQIHYGWSDDTSIKRFTPKTLSGDFTEISHTYTEDTAHNIAIGGENITHLYCGNNRITALDVSKYPALEELGCYENQITHLDVSKNPKLTKLECWSNPLESLNVGNNTALTVIC